MSKKTPMPPWVRRLYKELVFGIQLEGKTRLQTRYTPGGVEDGEADFLEIFPAPIGAAKARAKDGKGAKSFISFFESDSATDAFDTYEWAHFGYDGEGHPQFEFRGMKDEHEIVVLLNIAPLDGTDAVK